MAMCIFRCNVIEWILSSLAGWTERLDFVASAAMSLVWAGHGSLEDGWRDGGMELDVD